MATHAGFGVGPKNKGWLIPIIKSGIIQGPIPTQQPTATQPATQAVFPFIYWVNPLTQLFSLLSIIEMVP